jgi:hypothetical protein
VRRKRLLEADLLMVLPARLHESKQPKKAMMAARAFQEAGAKGTKLVFVASHKTPYDDAGKSYMAELRAFGEEIGLAPEDALFTNEEHPRWEHCTPKEVVRDLQMLADIFILPSLSEAHSLVALEAATCRNVLILNQDFPAMADWFDRGTTYNWMFSSLRGQTVHHGGDGEPSQEHEMNYYRHKALQVLHDLQFNAVWKPFSHVKRERNLQAVCERYLLPAIHGMLD